MLRYLELVEYICLALSIGNLVAIGAALRKKRPVFRVMCFLNILGIVVISNLVVWIEGWYVDENNLSGSTASFFVNIGNIVLFAVNVIMIARSRKEGQENGDSGE